MKLIISGIILTFILTGCSSEPAMTDDDSTQMIESEQMVESEQMIETESEIEVEPEAEVETEPVEKVGSGQSTAFSPYTTTAKVTSVGDDITNVELEEFLEDGTSKNEASRAGTYTSPNYTKGEFYEQIDSLEAYIIENDEFPTLSNGSDVDGVSGASVNLSGFEEAYLMALQNSK